MSTAKAKIRWVSDRLRPAPLFVSPDNSDWTVVSTKDIVAKGAQRLFVQAQFLTHRSRRDLARHDMRIRSLLDVNMTVSIRCKHDAAAVRYVNSSRGTVTEAGDWEYDWLCANSSPKSFRADLTGNIDQLAVIDIRITAKVTESEGDALGHIGHLELACV